jgi:hypothetical protein
MRDEGSAPKYIIEYLKVFAIFLALRLVMIETGVTIINIPVIDGALSQGVFSTKQFLKQFERQ